MSRAFASSSAVVALTSLPAGDSNPQKSEYNLFLFIFFLFIFLKNLQPNWAYISLIFYMYSIYFTYTIFAHCCWGLLFPLQAALPLLCCSAALLSSLLLQ